MADPTSPQPRHKPGSPAPPRDGQFRQMFQSSHRWSHPSPAPPAQPQPPLLGQNNRVLVKISVCPPPNVSRSIHTTAHGVGQVGSCGALGVVRNTGVRGVSVCQLQNLHFPQRGDAMVGDPTLAEPLHPGSLHHRTPAPGSSRGASGGSGCKSKRPIEPGPHLQLLWKHPAPRCGSARDEGASLPLPALPPPFMGPFGLGRPCPCVPQPLGVSDLLSAGPDGACIARKSAS